MKIHLSFASGGVRYTVSEFASDYMSSSSYNALEIGEVRQVLERLWSVKRCIKDHDASWGDPKWYIEWVPVDKAYTREHFVTDILESVEKTFMPLSSITTPKHFSDVLGRA